MDAVALSVSTVISRMSTTTHHVIAKAMLGTGLMTGPIHLIAVDRRLTERPTWSKRVST